MISWACFSEALAGMSTMLCQDSWFYGVGIRFSMTFQFLLGISTIGWELNVNNCQGYLRCYFRPASQARCNPDCSKTNHKP